MNKHHIEKAYEHWMIGESYEAGGILYEHIPVELRPKLRDYLPHPLLPDVRITNSQNQICNCTGFTYY